MLSVTNLTKVYGRGRLAVKALNSVNINFPKTGLVIILGKSGCGKSTLLNILGGLDRPSSGDVVINGTPFSKLSAKQLDDYRNTYIGFVFQNFNIIENRTVYENIELALKLQNNEHDVNYIDDALNSVGLNGLGYRKPSELSGGQRQRVAIARALVKNPDVILADEPTGSLDSTTGDDLFVSLKRISKKKLVIIVTHDTETAFRYGDRIISMQDGVIVGDVDRTKKESDAETHFIRDNIMFVKAGHTLTLEEANSNLTEGQDNYLTFETDKQHIVLAYPDTIDEIDEGYQPGDFSDHTEAAPETVPKFELKRAVMSMKNCMAQAGANVRKRKARFIVMLVISIACMILFNIGLGLATVSPDRIIKQSIAKGKLDFISAESGRSYYYYDGQTKKVDLKNVFAAWHPGLYHETQLNFFTVNDTKKAQQYQYYDTFIEIDNGYGNEASTNLTGYIEYSDFTYSGLLLYGGEYPKATNEAMITDHLAGIITSCGVVIKNGERYELYTPAVIDDLIGKNVLIGSGESSINLKITGIVKTNSDKIAALEKKNTTYTGLLSKNESQYYLNLFVCEGFYDYYLDGMTELSGKILNVNCMPTSANEYSYPFDANNVTVKAFKPGLSYSACEELVMTTGYKLADNELIVSYDFALNLYYSIFNKMDDITDMSVLLGDYYINFITEYSVEYKEPIQNEETLYKIVGILNLEEYGDNNGMSVYLTSDKARVILKSANALSAAVMPTGNVNIKDVVATAKTNDCDIKSALFSNVINTIDSMKGVSTVLLIMSGILAFFVLITIMNFLSLMIKERNKEIGIMRALGAGNSVTLKVFYIELLLLDIIVVITSSAVAAWILSSVNKLVGSIIMNGVIWVSFSFTNFIVSALAFTLFLFLVALPLLGRLARKQPIDVINAI